MPHPSVQNRRIVATFVKDSPILLEEEWNLHGLALVPQGSYPVGVARPGSGSGLTPCDNPVDGGASRSRSSRRAMKSSLPYPRSPRTRRTWRPATSGLSKTRVKVWTSPLLLVVVFPGRRSQSSSVRAISRVDIPQARSARTAWMFSRRAPRASRRGHCIQPVKDRSRKDRAA